MVSQKRSLKSDGWHRRSAVATTLRRRDIYFWLTKSIRISYVTKVATIPNSASCPKKRSGGKSDQFRLTEIKSNGRLTTK